MPQDQWFTYDPTDQPRFDKEDFENVRRVIVTLGKIYGQTAKQLVENVIQGFRPLLTILDEVQQTQEELAEELFKTYDCPQHGQYLLKDHCPLCRRQLTKRSSRSLNFKINSKQLGPLPQTCPPLSKVALF